jgi:ankyrin repeat protein
VDDNRTADRWLPPRDPNARRSRLLARGHNSDAVGFASAVLDAGGGLDIRDDVLKSTPLGWACRWGLTDVVKLFLDRGADPVEDAEPWATPRAWAEKMHHQEILELLNVARPNVSN